VKKISINQSKLKQIEATQVGPVIGRVIEKKIIQATEMAQREAYQELEDHPVTKEIESGPNGFNQSGTLGGYGNLFSFIGFEEGMRPVDVVKYFFKRKLNVKAVPSSYKSNNIKFMVEVPDKEEIFQATPMPWIQGRSWAEGIERGISGLAKYINRMSFSSRSGQGIQANHRVRSGGFRNTKYISQIISSLKEKIFKNIK
jgi:hypothetical protein